MESNDAQSGATQLPCDNGCGRPRKPARSGVEPRFCSDKCRAEWSRKHDPSGIVKGVRRLANGRVSVVVHFDEREAEVALRFQVGTTVCVGRTDG